MAFNPDAYLQEKTANNQQNNSEFNPDAYLQSKMQNAQSSAPASAPQPGSMADLVNQKLAQKGMTLSQGFHQIANQPVTDTIKQAVEYIPHGVGLTARNISEGVGNMIDFATTPLRYLIKVTTGHDVSGGGKALADYLSLPESSNPTERVTSEAEKLAAGGGGIMGAASKAQGMAKAGSVGQKVLQSIAANPEQQLGSLAGAGIAGGWIKEEGGPAWMQLIASLGGGIVGGGVVSGSQKLANFSKNIIDSMRKTPQLETKINTVINAALETKGIPASQVSGAVRRQLINDMQDALKQGDMSPDVVRRLVDYRLVGATPTSGTLTLDPGLITKQKNLAKIGVNSQDPALQRLSQIQNENNQKLIEGLNNIGAGTAVDQYGAAQKTMGALKNLQQGVKQSVIDPLYQKARNSQGRSVLLDPEKFTQKANDLLDESMVGGLLPADVRNNLNKIATGKMPLTVDVAEQFKTAIAGLQRNTTDRGVRYALGLVRQALDDTPPISGQEPAAMQAFNTARKAHAAWMSIVDRTPALKAVMDGVEPDKFMQSYIIGSGKNASYENVKNLSRVIQANKDAQMAVRNNISQWLKDKALNNASDEIGKFSQSGYNKALKAIGDNKLKLFYTPDEINMLKAIGRVASYEQVQPTGSAVNNSNTAGTALANVLDWLGNIPILRKIPFGAQIVGNPAKSVSQNIEATKVLRIPKAPKVALPKQKTYPVNTLSAGVLASQKQDRKNGAK